jgi:hypothetical protein
MMKPRRPPTDDVVTRSFGAAVFLHALGYPVEHVRSRDGSQFNAYITFPPSARADLERYYKTRDLLNAEIERYINPDTNPEEQTNDTTDRR